MKLKINKKTWKKFLSSGSAGGVLLFLCVVASLIIANSALGPWLNQILDTPVGYHSDSLHLYYPVSIWINDGLMAIFFLLVGLEIKRELVEGELSEPKKALLPILSAAGGAIVPALIYYAFNFGEPTSSGWGIPMATDIAFALAVITLLGKRVPASLKIFLAALAIVDDLMAILVIALFYSDSISVLNLLYAGIVFAFLIVLNRMNVKNIWFYIIPGVVMWYFVHNSGIHATIAGVLTALTLPTTPDSTESPLEKLEHLLLQPVNLLIVPIFALANTNIEIVPEMISGLVSPLGMGIIFGLLFGKPIGILLVSWLGVKFRICSLPHGSKWIHLLGVGFLGGIGFTMSIFISLLSFSDPAFVAEAKFAVLTASLLSGVLGYVVLSMSSKKKKEDVVIDTVKSQNY